MRGDSTPFAVIRKLVEAGAVLRVEEMLARRYFPDGKGASLFCALHAHMRAGHICLKEKKLGHLVSDSSLCKKWEEELSMPDSPHLVEEDGSLYLKREWELEEEIVQQVCRLSGGEKKQVPEFDGTGFTEEQKAAIAKALSRRLSIITGGPGTGKTSVAVAIAKAFAGRGHSHILLAAPTGKAASHLIAKVGGQGGTIHSLLRDKLPFPADLLIVDECSMVDTALFAELLGRVGESTHVVLMGDRHQLPAVEGGSVFADLVASPLPITTFTKVFRSDREEILGKAAAILEGKGDLLNLDLGLNTGRIRAVYEALWQKVKHRFPTKVGAPEDLLKKIDDFRILSTLRKGPLGVDALNRFLHERFNSPVSPIMIIRSDRKRDLSNGEVGILIEEEAYFPGGKTFALFDLPPFEYAYCLSVHKSQGSEYKEVLLLVPEGSEAFGKEVLYTAVTRAKEGLMIDGNREQIATLLTQHSSKISRIADKLRI